MPSSYTQFCQPLQLGLPVNWIFVLSLVAPHFLHAMVWLRPSFWKSAFRASAVERFAAADDLLKAAQAACALLWVWSSRSSGICFDVAQLQLSNWAAGFVLLALGLALSSGVFAVLGKQGVYYGRKLGLRHVAEEQGWPFTLVPHPQYVGIVLTVWAPVVMLYQQLPAQTWFAAALSTTLYCLTAVMEDYL